MPGKQNRQAFQFIILLGIVSLLADVIYEGVRSITGPFLASLGASAALVGLTAGLGEFLGYALRLFSGYAADRTSRYWLFTFLGYGMILTVPLLALAGRWETAVLLLVAERIGKALRSPSRDAILSHATRRVGRGLGFGLHETLNQIGALLGPALFSGVMILSGGYRTSFALLALPALAALAILRLAWNRAPLAEDEGAGDSGLGKNEEKGGGLSRLFWLYTFFTFISVSGFASFQLISYHIKVRGMVGVAKIPLFYALAMAVDGGVALLIGKMYDRFGLRSLVVIPLLTGFVPLFAFSDSMAAVVTGMVLWGLVMGIHETSMRAAVADLSPFGRRGTAYGIFNTVYGAAWLASGWLMGMMYGISVAWIILFTVAMEIISLPLLILVMKERRCSVWTRGRS